MADAAATLERFRTAPDRKARRTVMDAFLAADTISLSAVLTLLRQRGELALLLELIARPKARLAVAMVPKLMPLIAERRLPVPLRVAAAAKLIETTPEDVTNVKAIAAAITTGLGKSRTFERLVQVQNRVAQSEALDTAVATAAKRARLQCPKCRVKLPRIEFIRHLWFKHRLVFEGNRAREPGPLVESAIQSALRTNAVNAFDTVYNLALVSFRKVEPVQIHQAILARSGAEPEDLEPLKKRATEQHAGLCPTCFATVPHPVPALPPPLVLTDERLSGDGFDIERACVSADRQRGVRRALPAAVATTVATSFLAPGLALGIGTAATAMLYWSGQRQQSSSDSKSELVDRAWRDLVPKMGRTAAAVSFLTRLCRTSLDHGTPASRTELVWGQVEQAAVLSGKGGAHLQWFAAVRVLQASDAGHIGKDWVPALAGLFAPLFRAEASPLYTEAAAETLLHAETFEDPDAARLRIVLAGEALAAGLTTADFATLTEFNPHLAKLFAGTDAWYDALSSIWADRRRKSWKHIGDADTVFDFAANPGNGKTLAACPDTLLADQTDSDLGLVLIGQRGLTVRGYLVDSIPALLQLHQQQGWRERDALRLKKWLVFREDLLNKPRTTATTPRLRAILAPLAVPCPLCRNPGFVKRGEVGAPWPLK